MSDVDLLFKQNVTRDIPLMGKWEFPPIRGTTEIPEGLLGFNFAKTSNKHNQTIHFYVHDYQFERVWSKPDVYIKMLSRFRSCLTPDFSLYREMPLAMQLYNVFRSRMIGYLMEQGGIKVIPTLQWSDESSFDFCFDGLPQRVVYSVSTVGVARDKIASKYPVFFRIRGIFYLAENLNRHTGHR